MSTDGYDVWLTASQLGGLAFPSCNPSDRATHVRARSRLKAVIPFLRSTTIQSARPTINFHPDRPCVDGRTVIERLWSDGVYRNQFEVRITNGDPSAFPGGRRYQRESEMFGGHYDGAPHEDRPKYGSLDLLFGPSGGWPRFGSSYLVLKPAILDRSTFLVGGGLSSRSWVGSRRSLEDLLGTTRPSPHGLARRSWRSDGWIELHVHGPVRLAADVAKLVLDDSFLDTRTGDIARKTAKRYAVALEWAPPLRSDSRTWRVPASRSVPRALVADGAFRDHIATASEIGRLLYADYEFTRERVPMDSTVRDGVAKYLWNRILLSDDVSSRWEGHRAVAIEKMMD